MKLVLGRAALGVAALGSALLLGACHRLTLMSQDGTMGTGRASGVGGSGIVEVHLNGKTYKGEWGNAQGGSVAFGSFGRVPVSAYAVNGSSTGSALLRADGGGTLRCRFNFGAMSQAGYGECQDETGKDYELQIH